MKEDTENQGSSAPTYEEIEHILRNIQPRPSTRFYHNLQNAPWNKKPHMNSWYLWRYAILTLGLLIVASFLISPPLRAMARNWISFFLTDPQDHMQISLGDLSPKDLHEYASPDNFPYTVEQASKLAGHPVNQPTHLLPGMDLVGARFESTTHTVVLLYQGAGYNLFLSQHPTHAGQEYFSIGASAKVEQVTIGNIWGEFVSGGWVNLDDPPNTEEDMPKNIDVQWDASLPQYTLRWQSQGLTYQLRSLGSSGPHKTDLILLAQTIDG